MSVRSLLPADRRSAFFQIASDHRDRLVRAGFSDIRSFFSDPRVRVWRTPGERENAVLELDGNIYHVKRDRRYSRREQVVHEAWGVALLEDANIRSVPIVAAGRRDDGLSVIVSRDLTGFDDARNLLRRGLRFEQLLEPTAEIAARLHRGGLHHRDLYLNHFFLPQTLRDIRADDIHLIDAVRVRPLPWLLPRRWIIKDIGQFIFSTFEHQISEIWIDRWLDVYAKATGLDAGRLRSPVYARARWIASHDAALRARRPDRNVEMPADLQAKRGST
jgi:Lipopolysaccharide kinase (Kdo/WaaP) family